jgi:hypothetical protein
MNPIFPRNFPKMLSTFTAPRLPARLCVLRSWSVLSQQLLPQQPTSTIQPYQLQQQLLLQLVPEGNEPYPPQHGRHCVGTGIVKLSKSTGHQQACQLSYQTDAYTHTSIGGKHFPDRSRSVNILSHYYYRCKDECQNPLSESRLTREPLRD